MNKRLNRIDEIRGITLISMVIYHFMWDLIYIAGIKVNWYAGPVGKVWQQSICITFIFVSGFCFCLGKHHLKRSLIVFFSGALVTAVTLIAMPQNRIVFGVLTFIGSAGLFMIPLHRLNLWLEEKLDAKTLSLTMFIGNILLFVSLYRINYRTINLIFKKITMPSYMYKGYLATYIGFCDPSFFSTDYFALMPWIFLYLAGYFLFRYSFNRGEKSRLIISLRKEDHLKWISFIGKHTLIIYLLHQPVLYIVTIIIQKTMSALNG